MHTETHAHTHALTHEHTDAPSPRVACAGLGDAGHAFRRRRGGAERGFPNTVPRHSTGKDEGEGESEVSVG